MPLLYHPTVAAVWVLLLCPPKGKGVLGGLFRETTLFHPFTVHFPVALWLTSALFDLFYLTSRNQFYARAAQYLIGLGILGALLSIYLGFCDAIPLVQEGVGQAFVDKHALHQKVAYVTTALYSLSFLLRWRRPDLRRAWVGGLMVVGAALSTVTAYLGGDIRLVM
ncbi:MAG: hypothetical protein HY355_05835 [Armatimonadetes bacterium]|nr:hypothetical protein [Armatimonadota bacterium]